MAIDAIRGGNAADVLGLISEASQGPALEAASMSVLKIALSEANSNAEALVSEIRSAGQLNVYA